MDDIKVVLIKQCGCEFNYAVNTEAHECMRCDTTDCKGHKPPCPEFVTLKGRLVTAVEWENHHDVYSKDTELASGWLRREDKPPVLN